MRATLPASSRRAGSAPAGVAARVAESTVELRSVVRHGDGGPEEPRAARRPPDRGRRPREREHGGGARGVAAERLPRRAGEVPAVQHELVQGDDAHHLGGRLDTTGSRRAFPCPGGRPGLHQRREPLWQKDSPLRIEGVGVGLPGSPPVVHRWRLARRPGEGQTQAHEVVEQACDGYALAGGGGVQAVVTDAVEEAPDDPGRGCEVDRWHGGPLGKVVMSGRGAAPCQCRPPPRRDLIAGPSAPVVTGSASTRSALGGTPWSRVGQICDDQASGR